MKQSLCDERGHCWASGAAPGWFICRQVLGSKPARGGASFQSVYCNAVAYCAGCLGYCIGTYLMVPCAQHVNLDVRGLPSVAREHETLRRSSHAKQQSLF